MPYEIPTLGKLIADGEKDIAYELGLQKLPPVSVEQALNVSFSSQVRDLYDHQSWIKDQIIPSATSDDETIIKTATYEGVIRKQATFASGPVTFTSQSLLPAETRMQSDTNQVYQVLTSGEVRDGEVTVIVQAEEAGVAGNLAAGAVLTLLSPLPGTASAGVVAEGGITGGADTESIAELLDRLLYVRRNPRWAVLCMITSSGLAKWLASAARGRWDAWHGPGTVGLAWLYDDREDIVPTRKDLKTMEQYLFCHKHPATGVMVGKPGGIEVWPVQVRLKKVDLSIRLTPDGQANRNAVRANLTALQKTLALVRCCRCPRCARPSV